MKQRKNLILTLLILALLAVSLFGPKSGTKSFPSAGLLLISIFLIFPSMRQDQRASAEFTQFVLEQRFGKNCELVRWSGLAVLVAGFFFNAFHPDASLGTQVFLLSLLIFMIHGLWLVLVIADQKAIWREKWDKGLLSSTDTPILEGGLDNMKSNTKQNTRLILIGILPLAVGLFQELMLQVAPALAPIGPISSVIFLLLWGILCNRVSYPAGRALNQALSLHLMAAVMLAVFLIQEFLVDHTWTALNYLSQTFFMPFFSLAAMPRFSFDSTVYIWPAFIISFLLMFLVGCIGCCTKVNSGKLEEKSSS